MVKSKRKFMVSFLLSLSIFGIFVMPASAAYQKVNCTYAGIECRQVNVTSYGTSVAYSDYVYATKGQELSLSVGSDGPFNLTAQLVDSSGNVFTPEITHYNTVYVNVAYAGNYRVKVVCKDSSTSERCKGFGSVSE